MFHGKCAGGNCYCQYLQHVRKVLRQTARRTHRVCRRKTSRNTQRGDEAQSREQCKHETGRGHPSYRHCWHDHDSETFPMAGEVSLWQFNSNCKKSSRQCDTHDLQGHGIRIGTPRPRIENVCAMGTDDNSERCSKDRFSNI
jgi:hypothetical protein